MEITKLNEFTLVDVINRKVRFTKTNPRFNIPDFQNDNEGALLAYSEMLEDISTKEMSEDEFVSKYLAIIKILSKKFENDEFENLDEIEKMSGYNNAIVSVLICLDPIYEYEVEE